MSQSILKSEVERLLQQQAALAHFGSFGFQESSLKKILTEAARVCAESLDVPFCKISRYRKENNDFIVEAGHGWDAGVIGQVVTQCNKNTPHGRAFITGTPVIIENLQKDSDIVLPNYYHDHNIVSVFNVIIKSKDKSPYGILEINSPVPHVYDKHDINFLTGFANVLAEAVTTADHNQAMCNNLEQMAIMVDQMKAMVAEKEQMLDDRAVMAEELKHRVRNNLQLINGMLATQLKLASSRVEKASTYAIMRRVMSLAQVYEQLLGTGLNRVIELGDYINALCINLPDLQPEKNSSVKLVWNVTPNLVNIDTATALGMVVAELISNGFEHAFTRAGGSIRVELSAAATGEGGTLRVSDDGRGFVEQPGSKRHGIGLVRRLMEQIRGDAELHSAHGTQWTLRFPVISPIPNSNI